MKSAGKSLLPVRSGYGILLRRILRNIPFVILGGIVCLLYHQKRGEAGPAGDRSFRCMWILILLSFLFYIPVAVAAGIVPILGMLMLPKTVCYILMVAAFMRAERAELNDLSE